MFHSDITGKDYKTALSRQNAENRFGKPGVRPTRVWTQEDREKTSRRMREIGSRPEFREKIANANRGKKRTHEQRAALSEALKKHWAENPRAKKETPPKERKIRDDSHWDYLRGRVLSDEVKEKLRLANLGKEHSDKTKKKMSDAKKDVPKSPEHVASMRLAQQRRRAAERNEPWAVQWYIDNGKEVPEPRLKKNR